MPQADGNGPGGMGPRGRQGRNGCAGSGLGKRSAAEPGWTCRRNAPKAVSDRADRDPAQEAADLTRRAESLEAQLSAVRQRLEDLAKAAK
jgi:hypothetical protein